MSGPPVHYCDACDCYPCVCEEEIYPDDNDLTDGDAEQDELAEDF